MSGRKWSRLERVVLVAFPLGYVALLFLVGYLLYAR